MKNRGHKLKKISSTKQSNSFSISKRQEPTYHNNAIKKKTGLATHDWTQVLCFMEKSNFKIGTEDKEYEKMVKELVASNIKYENLEPQKLWHQKRKWGTKSNI